MVNYFKRNLYLIGGVFFICYFFLATNLFFLQVKNIHFFIPFSLSSHENCIIPDQGNRGSIVDRNDLVLAMNVPIVYAYIDPCALQKPVEVRAFLAHYFPEAYTRLLVNKDKRFVLIKRRLSDEQQRFIADAKLSDIHLATGLGRYYPIQATSNIVGVVGIDNVGLSGIEYQMQHYLANDTLAFNHKDHTERVIKLTIDAKLQFLVQEELSATIKKFEAREGTVIIIDPVTGDILAMVSLPSFDPNDFRSEDIRYMNNKVVTDGYEPGSVMKVFAALAALQENIVTVDELIDCKGTKSTMIDGRIINTCIAHGTLAFVDVIALSNNIGIAQVAKRLGPKLYDYYIRNGFGKKSGIEFPGEQVGFVNPPEWWSKQSLISLSYGYEIVVTPLQLALAFSIIANNGYTVRPRLVQSYMKNDDILLRSEKLYTNDAIVGIEQILEQTTLRGTARSSQLAGFIIKSKTGTANMLEDGKYNSTKNIYTCAGIVQKNDYKRVVVVCVKQAAQKDLYASTVAAPLFERVAQVMVINEKIN